MLSRNWWHTHPPFIFSICIPLSWILLPHIAHLWWTVWSWLHSNHSPFDGTGFPGITLSLWIFTNLHVKRAVYIATGSKSSCFLEFYWCFSSPCLAQTFGCTGSSKLCNELFGEPIKNTEAQASSRDTDFCACLRLSHNCVTHQNLRIIVLVIFRIRTS